MDKYFLFFCLHVCTLEILAVFADNVFDNVINCLLALPTYNSGGRYVDGLLFVLMDGCLLQNIFSPLPLFGP